MGKNKKRKKNKKRNRKNNVNKRNEFTQHPDSRTQENMSANKKKIEEKPKENSYEKKSCFGWIETFMITLIATVIGGLILTYIGRSFLSPMNIDISTQQDGLVGHVNIDQHDEECKVYYMDSYRTLGVNLDNNSDISMYVTDVCVNVIKCTDIMEEDIEIGDYQYTGDVKKPICLKTKIEHHTGKMKTEIDLELNPWYASIPDNCIRFPIYNNSSEKFSLSMYFEKQGYYNIEVEFSYMYDGKQRTIKTDPLNYIFINKMNDSTFSPANLT